jgi:hypothetical protein
MIMTLLTEFDSNWTSYKDSLTDAFFAFQAIRNPMTDEKRANFTFSFETQQLKIVALDLRSERNVKKEQMLSQASKSIASTLISSADDKPIFILSPVTLTRISGKIEEFLSQFSNTVWRYTRYAGYGLFMLSFLALQLKDENSHISNFLSGLFLIAVSTYSFAAAGLRKFLGQKSEIEGQPLVWIRKTFLGLLVLGCIGVYWELQNGPITFDLIKSEIKTYLIHEAHNLIFLFGLLSLSFVLLFDAKRLKQCSKTASKWVTRVGYGLLVIFSLLLLWHGLPEEYIRPNFILKAPLAALSFVYLVIAVLESLGAVDEIAGLDDDIKDSWSSEPNAKELDWFLGLIKPLKSPTYLLCGDIHTGGLSFIKTGNKTIPQITTSPITYPPMAPMAEKLTSGLKKISLPRKDPKAIAENSFFISQRNFGIVTVSSAKTSTVEFIFENQDSIIEVTLRP